MKECNTHSVSYTLFVPHFISAKTCMILIEHDFNSIGLHRRCTLLSFLHWCLPAPPLLPMHFLIYQQAFTLLQAVIYQNTLLMPWTSRSYSLHWFKISTQPAFFFYCTTSNELDEYERTVAETSATKYFLKNVFNSERRTCLYRYK